MCSILPAIYVVFTIRSPAFVWAAIAIEMSTIFSDFNLDIVEFDPVNFLRASSTRLLLL